ETDGEMARHLGGRQALYRIARRDLSGDENARVNTAPSGVSVLRNARVRPVEERGPNVQAGAREARDLDQDLVPEAEELLRLHPRPVETRDRHVLAEGTGLDRVAFRLEGLDLLEREEAERPVGATVVLCIPMRVTLEPRAQHAGPGDRPLRHPARRDVDLDDASSHPASVEDEDPLAGGLRVEEPVRVGCLAELEAVREKTLQRHSALD